MTGGLIGKATRIAWTVRYLSASQLSHRVLRRCRQAVWKLRGAKANFATPDVPFRRWNYQAGLCAEALGDPRWRPNLEQAARVLEALERNEFTFLNHTRRFEGAIGWNDPGLAQLWRYNLHYFHYLEALQTLRAASPGNAPYEQFKRLVSAWMDGNERLLGDGWHPYTISLRLVNWINAANTFAAELDRDREFRSRFLGSVRAQAANLHGNLELDVRGNHLLENIRALLWAGASFDAPEARRWKGTAMRLLRRELDAQVCADGGHFERCPGYHVLVLRDFIEIARWLGLVDGAAPAWLLDRIRLTLRFLVAMRTPEGWTPMFKDTASNAYPDPAEVLAAGAVLLNDPEFKLTESAPFYATLVFGKEAMELFATWTPRPPKPRTELLGASGYFVARGGAEDLFVMDVGKPCPDYLPAHAHADIFTFELWSGGLAWLVDSGVYEYKPGRWRDYFRSTRAHNTIEVGGRNQSDVYSSFRVGRRARIEGVRAIEIGDGFWAVAGTHDGYARQGARHTRVAIVKPGEIWILGDLVAGDGRSPAKGFLHFHPQVAVGKTSDGSFELTRDARSLHLSLLGMDRVEQVRGVEGPTPQGWYSDRFGVLEANSVLSMDLGRAGESIPTVAIRAGGAIRLTGSRVDANGLQVEYVLDGIAKAVRVPASLLPSR